VKEIPITDLMSSDVELVSPEKPLHDVVKRMQENHQSCVLAGENGVPAGIITERDLVRVLGKLVDQPDLIQQPASVFMSSPPHTVQQDQSLFDALVISRAERVRHLPVINEEQKLVGLLTQTDLTAAHFRVIELQRSLIERAIEDRTEKLRSANRELELLSMEDPLLGIGNRRAMEVDMEHTHSLACRYQRPYTAVLMDIDHFKRYNDHYGHLAGDQALQQVVAIIQSAIRKSDRLYRYGGEEFLLLLPDTDSEGAEILAKRLIRDLQMAALPHCKSPYGIVTMSAGLSAYRTDVNTGESDWRKFVRQADQSLYQAKNLGRNRVA
jgi:diguanylate cyclase (GGDEF)-like protein